MNSDGDDVGADKDDDDDFDDHSMPTVTTDILISYIFIKLLSF